MQILNFFKYIKITNGLMYELVKHFPFPLLEFFPVFVFLWYTWAI